MECSCPWVLLEPYIINGSVHYTNKNLEWVQSANTCGEADQQREELVVQVGPRKSSRRGALPACRRSGVGHTLPSNSAALRRGMRKGATLSPSGKCRKSQLQHVCFC